ncbi:hypothetical protein Ae201684P_003316 [Aphanomyces euteiches]|uniref:Protein phosphatase 1 regulatory subunit 7 n=2 Tax=Aphanomyces euteiches TaxID=100861 RepID=A0A6G0WAT7_9STRA|nr:hypothetical protein Ae201684_017003 [Aphanomyces euteiches]KAH9073814.1 hypothetical protein Ae201684P_003316 [Aphanomyces euteiches]
MDILDADALRILAKEDNSSKFAVDAHHRGIQRIGDLSSMPKLYSLDVSFNQIKVLETLHTAKDLRELKVYNNKLQSSDGLKANQNLEVLVMSDNEIKEISTDFTELFKLKTLQLHGNKLTRIEHLKNCRQLTYLDLSRNRISGSWANALQALVALEYLNLSDNQITSIGSLENLKKLEEINLSGNILTSLSANYPPNLMVLRADRNKISDLNSLPVMPNLNELYVQHNFLTDVSCIIERTPQLESFDIRNNRIRGLNDVVCLAKCSTLEDLWIRGNPCTLSESYLSDLVLSLPSVQFIDDVSSKQIQESPNPQKLVEAASQPPSTGRPATPLVRPSSSGSRPSTAEGRPLIFRPSSRAGSQTKMLAPSEVEKAQNEVRERLQKLRHLMGKMCSSTEIPKTKKTNSTSVQRPASNQSSSADPIEQKNSIEFFNDKIQQRPKTCEMGTDPLDDIPIRPQTSAGLKREGEIQTIASPPKLNIKHQSTDVNIMIMDDSPTFKTTDAPIDFGGQMKIHLLSEIKSEEIALEISTTTMPTEPPRVESWRQAEQRHRPTEKERTGFRLFRIPESAKRFMHSATSAT